MKKVLDYDQLLDAFKAILREQGQNFTNQREAILKTLYEATAHLTPEELHQRIQKKFPDQKTGIATVYRTLTLLEEHSLVTSLSFGTQGKKYELSNREHHDHMICNRCGKIIEFVDETIEVQQEEIAQKHHFKISDHSMQIYGICNECQEKEND